MPVVGTSLEPAICREEGFQITVTDVIELSKLQQINLSLDSIVTPLRDYYCDRNVIKVSSCWLNSWTLSQNSPQQDKAIWFSWSNNTNRTVNRGVVKRERLCSMLMTFLNEQTAKWIVEQWMLSINSPFVTRLMKWSQQWMSGSMVDTCGQ